MTLKTCQYGWTLIELLIVLTIVIVLATIAMPEFSSRLLPAHRQLMQAEMLRIAQHLEERYHEQMSYKMIELGVFPVDEPNYRLSLVVSDKGQKFLLKAHPINGQKQDGYLYLDSSGSRRLYPDGTGGSYVSW